MTRPERDSLRVQCEKIVTSQWHGVSSSWAAGNILQLIAEVDSLTEERDRFAVYLARAACAMKVQS